VEGFIAKDFLDIASRGSTDVALTSLTSTGKIRRIRRGLYDLPIVNPDPGGELSLDIDDAARTIARRNRWTIVPDGPWAANLVGLSTQVPAKIVYLSDGPVRGESIQPFGRHLPLHKPSQNGPRSQGFAAPRRNGAPLTAPGRSEEPFLI
jgi:Family of unknown function (DUF6088)